MKKGDIKGPRVLLNENKSKIAHARVAAGLTQVQLAKLLGVDHRHVAKYEAEPPKTIAVYKRIADVLGIDWKTLVD